MFDLEAQIASWRVELIQAGLDDCERLDELESHLRDDVEQQIESGVEAQRAFESATRRMGQPDLLQSEFAKFTRPKRRAKRAVLAFAGVAKHSETTTMNTPQMNPGVERAWVTYVKSATWLLPALLVWAVSTVFVFPKLKQIMFDAGFNASIPRTGFLISDFYINYGIYVLIGAALTFLLLEGRSRIWPRYRRACLGFGVFVLNFGVLALIFTMLVSSLLAAPALFHGGQASPARSTATK